MDVTGFPDTSRLLLVADALITDYSSVMFDFSVTGKPMYFLVPDIEHYRGQLRGFYFDLTAHAPVRSSAPRRTHRCRPGRGSDRFRRPLRAVAREVQLPRRRPCRERVVGRILDQRLIERD